MLNIYDLNFCLTFGALQMLTTYLLTYCGALCGHPLPTSANTEQLDTWCSQQT